MFTAAIAENAERLMVKTENWQLPVFIFVFFVLYISAFSAISAVNNVPS